MVIDIPRLMKIPGMECVTPNVELTGAQDDAKRRFGRPG